MARFYPGDGCQDLSASSNSGPQTDPQQMREVWCPSIWGLISIGLNFMVSRNGSVAVQGRKCPPSIFFGGLNYMVVVLQ